MDSLELKKYINEAQEFGLTNEKIIENLTEAGWDSSDIYTAMGVVRLTKIDMPVKDYSKIEEKIEEKVSFPVDNKPRTITEEKAKSVEITNNAPKEKIQKTDTKEASPSLIPLIGVTTVGILFIVSAMYIGNLFSIEVDKASGVSASTYNILVQESIANKKSRKESTILFVGDIMLSEKRGTGKEMEKRMNYKYPFLKLARFLQKADLTFGNLEGPISSRGEDIGGTYSFRANPKATEGLALAGFDVLSIANNHIFDWGNQAFFDTISNLNSVDIDSVGGGEDLYSSLKPVIKNVNGTKVAFVAFSAVGYDIGNFEAKENKAGKTPFSKEIVIESINNIRDNNWADVVVVSLHWGKEYKRRSSKYQQDLAYAIIDAGANLIVGHHPHVVQEVEAYKNGWIAYSLGNFIFDQDFSLDTMMGLMLEVKIKSGEIVKVNPIPIKISETFQPYIEPV